MKIRVCSSGNRTVDYAANELAKYLNIMTGIQQSIVDSSAPGSDGLRIGLLASFPELRTPSVTDPYLDDAIAISVDGGSGVIAGINSRSVLIAVYRYLTEQGCRWLRPGSDGEYIPVVDTLHAVHISETPSYRHRGVCIEGAVSVDHVKNMIDWLPKVGYNGYFTQFRESYTFFDRWYSHEGNPLLASDHISVDEAKKYLADCVDEIDKRSLLYHAVGHGWTCEPFGISGLSWDSTDVEIDDTTKSYLAKVNGERKLWGGVPLNTNLCYGNTEVRRRIVDDIVAYSESNPQIDLMHFWLADGTNNHCECSLCKDTRPSDFYVKMLNELDQKLTEKKLLVKIVFLIYVDLLWPPVEQKIANPDRFILMFEPITRTYSDTLKKSEQPIALPPYHRNQLKMPKSVEENVAFFKEWKKNNPCDSFDFDYHLMWDHYRDPGYSKASEIISEDVKVLGDIGLNGYISCQTQRASFPTGLPMYTLGKSLWNKKQNFDDIANDYFVSAFGPDGKWARNYLSELSELFDPVYLRGEKVVEAAEAAHKLETAKDTIEKAYPIIKNHAEAGDTCWEHSWQYLKHHADINMLLAQALKARALGDMETARAIWQQVVQTVRQREGDLHTVLDVMLYIGTLSSLFN